MFELNIAQIFGLLSFTLGILCFYQRDDRKLKIMMLLLQLNNVLHYGLLGAWTASLSSLLSVARTGLAIRTKSRRLAYLFMLLSIILGIWVGDHWTDMFAILGSCMGTYAVFCLSGIRMRLAFLLGAVFWLTNNIIVGSLGGTLLESTLIIVNLNTIYRLYRQRQKTPA
ncbi:YgjV family protein [Saccharophagus sp. K07]|jgi:hypothetical protein|uniref:YgjV family protein n=1 Tax=Saccharophagus sp. K07 TaxID=2283636 RepID=UPI001652032D|nr:YgjV family protein [Saccharophagus sp. K07]MBC6905965.1 YgjV family protein [Saccharophagus sp. K07]